MALIEWNESLSVGVEEIDFQHRRWIDMINAMDEALSVGGAEKLEQIKDESIKAMVDYAWFHFKYEEQYLKDLGYPELAAHREDHNRFKMNLRQIQADVDRGFQPLNTQLMSIMMNWLKDHIMMEDKKYAAYAEQAGQ